MGAIFRRTTLESNREAIAPVATAPAVAKTAQQSQATSGTPQSSFIKQNKLGVRKIARPGAKRGNRSALLSDEGSARLG